MTVAHTEIVKVFHEPARADARLEGLGFDAAIGQTPRYFIHGTVRPRNAPERVERSADYSFE